MADADNHFTRGIQRLTKIDIAIRGTFGLTDERIFDYPWIYAGLRDAEVLRLREY